MSEFIVTPSGILIPAPKAQSPAPQPPAAQPINGWNDDFEPRIWSHITDDHPEWSVAHCRRCGGQVQCCENMTPWVETGRGPFCFECFAVITKTRHQDECVDFDQFFIPGPKHPERARYVARMGKDDWPKWIDGGENE